MSSIWGPARRRLRLILAPVAAVSLAGLVACGSTSTSSGSGSGPSDAAMQAFSSCMAENGVTLPERGANGGPAGGAGAGSAGGAGSGSGGAGGGAAGSGGAGGADGGSPPTGAPQAGGAGGAMPAPPGVDATAWAAAQKACAQYAPAAPPTS